MSVETINKAGPQDSESDFFNTCHSKTRPDVAPTHYHLQEIHLAQWTRSSGNPGGAQVSRSRESTVWEKSFCPNNIAAKKQPQQTVVGLGSQQCSCRHFGVMKDVSCRQLLMGLKLDACCCRRRSLQRWPTRANSTFAKINTVQI